MFIGRTQELKRLRTELERPGQGAVLVYGRRRVGKSELIKQALGAITPLSIYYECKETSEADNLQSLSTLAAEALGLPPLAFNRIEDLLDCLVQRSATAPLILVLDEYPYLRRVTKGLDSILQAVLDRNRSASNLKLVLCGSYIDAMRSLLDSHNPLYGRVDLTINLKPMDYYEAAGFYSGFSNEDKVRLYSVLGGIPYYNRLVDTTLSVRENIKALIASPGARLENEVSMYLRSEISKIVNANEVFSALAQGYTRYKDILDQSHVTSAPAMVDVLDKLIGMELVQRQAPINCPDNRKRASYRIVDPLSLFYYRYVFSHSSQMAIMDADVFYNRYIERDFEEHYVPHFFEEVCRQYLVRQNRAGLMEPLFEEIGRYSYDDPVARANGEFDVVTRDERGYCFYEAKFTAHPVGSKVIAEEIAQVKATGLKCVGYGFVSRSGFEPKALEGIQENVRLITLDELYA
ncbi:MAG: ATP-binding protein [Coriobacteriales bacterium]